MARRKTTRKCETTPDSSFIRALRPGPMTTRKLIDRFGLSESYISKRLRKIPGTICEKVGAQQNIWRLG